MSKYKTLTKLAKARKRIKTHKGIISDLEQQLNNAEKSAEEDKKAFVKMDRSAQAEHGRAQYLQGLLNECRYREGVANRKLEWMTAEKDMIISELSQSLIRLKKEKNV